MYISYSLFRKQLLTPVEETMDLHAKQPKPRQATISSRPIMLLQLLLRKRDITNGWVTGEAVG